jgi:hypothetical protein
LTTTFRRAPEWLALGAGAVLTIRSAVTWVEAIQHASFLPDFVTFYAEGRLVAERGAAGAYDLALQREYQSTLAASMLHRAVFLPYINPPYFTLLLPPIARLGYLDAYAAWAAGNVLLLAISLTIMVRVARFHRLLGAAVILCAAGFTPVYVALVEGQSDMIMFLALALSCWAWRNDRPMLAGVIAGFAMVKPNVLLLLPVLFVVRHAWPALAGFGGAVAALAAVSILAFGPLPLVAYAHLIGAWSIHGQPGFPIGDQAALSGRAPFVALLGDSWSLLPLACLAVAVAVVIAGSRPNAALDFALAIAASIALSPYQNLHDLSLLVIPGVVALEIVGPRGFVVLVAAYAAIETTRFFGPWFACAGVLLLASLLTWERLRPARGAVPDSRPNAVRSTMLVSGIR